MDEMNNKNELDWYPTSNTSEQTDKVTTPVEPAAPGIENDPNSFAYNDNPNGNNTYYNYQPNVNGVSGGDEQPMAPLDNSAAQQKAKKSMIMGIIAAGLITTCACFPASIILGIIAIINALNAKKLSVTGGMPGMAIPGLICGIYGIAMGALMMIIFGIYAIYF